MEAEKLVQPTQIVQAEHVDNKFVHSFSYVLPKEMAKNPNYWTTFWIAPVDIEITSVMMYWSNANNISCVAQVENVIPGNSPGNGNDILKVGLQLNSSAENKGLIGYTQDEMNTYRFVPRSNRVGITIESGTLQDLSNFIITVTYKPVGRGGYRL